MSERTTHPLLREVASAAAPQPPPPAALAPAILPQVADEAPPSTAATDAEADTARYRRRVLLTLSVIVLTLVLYWASGYFFAYTDDAYVTSDFVSVAPYISGRIVSVNVVDNQTVKKGELLATIDPTPFQLALNEKQAKKTEAEAQLAVDRDSIAVTQAQRDDAAAQERLASDNVRRATPITSAGFYSRQGLDTLTAKEQEAKAALADAESAIAKSATDAGSASDNGCGDQR